MSPMDLATIKSHVAPGVCATLWTPRPMAETLTPRVKRILFAAKPQIVCLHGQPESIEVSARPLWSQLMLEAHDHAWSPRPWIGVACDSVVRQVIASSIPISKAVARFWSAASVANEMGAEVLVWDAEAACKIDPRKASDLFRQAIQSVRESFPTLVQAHTAYPAPTYHSEKDNRGEPLLHGYPWTVFCGPDGVDVDLPEIYVAPNEPASGAREFASPGAMIHALNLHRDSWALAQEKGWIRKDLPAWPYLQLHHVPYNQTITYGSDPRLGLDHPSLAVGVERYVTCGWTVEKDRCDAHGEVSLCALSKLARTNETVKEFQSRSGLRPDGIGGPHTLAAMDLNVPVFKPIDGPPAV